MIKLKWSSNFAYAIGLITSDGNLSSYRKYILFKSKDLELAEKFKKALNINNKIVMSVRGGEKIKNYCSVSFGDTRFYEFLNEIGLYPAKSKTIRMVKIPNNFFPDFLRGLFDGDGTFYTFWDRRWPNSFGYQISFASASPAFISWLQELLNKFYGVKGFVRLGDGVFNLRYVKGDTKKLYHAMYHKNNLLFLNRKYFKIQEALKKDRYLV